MIDYRGFGKSRGKRSQKRLFDDSQFMYNWLLKQYAEKNIILYGRSLGSGVAARIASWNNPRLLILDSPYYSFYYNTRRFLFWLPLKWMMRYPIRTDQYMETVSCPVHIIHGTNDFLIPFKQSEMLEHFFPEKIDLIPIEGAGHNNLQDFPAYYHSLYDSLEFSAKQKIKR